MCAGWQAQSRGEMVCTVLAVMAVSKIGQLRKGRGSLTSPRELVAPAWGAEIGEKSPFYEALLTPGETLARN